MIYNENFHIKNVDDVKVYFHYLVFEMKLNLHPDDNFIDYIDEQTNKPMFNSYEVDMHNRLMDESFEVCEKQKTDIYGIALTELERFLDYKVA